MQNWDAAQYLRFKGERTRPAEDLLGRIANENPAKVVDIGCGPGNSTRKLADRYPQADVLGVDSSSEMIRAAKEANPSLSFRLCDAGRELPALGSGFDVVFSNACIQWVPNHTQLLPDMMGLLKKGGTLAVQAPMNYEEPIHRIIQAVSSSERWRPLFSNPRVFYNLKPEEYYDLLASLTSEFSIWTTTYFHIMRTHADIIEWYKGTGLRPYLNALQEPDRSEFEREITAEVQKAYTPRPDGSIIFRFPRLFFTATKQ